MPVTGSTLNRMMSASTALDGEASSTTANPGIGLIAGGSPMVPARVTTPSLTVAVTPRGSLDAWLFTVSASVAAARVTVILPWLVATTAGAAGLVAVAWSRFTWIEVSCHVAALAEPAASVSIPAAISGAASAATIVRDLIVRTSFR